ncbi:class III poly(R)-hydroxyalkanoic acid synthase subunit PhaC [Ureibacillus manganicus]|uniref:Poly(3-hydroxyalkanoate) polymerase subunit PhaC n=1 Tax=Ureibacillus manganicus DSM 26584 TaxID=1384049 RepID=A0A0A3I4G2_9BACL|nr:class III poly(R)-hydroxyalkanoic acid synthase subunit PhaC [Ureibacillus manganicus]KGR79624.1 poly(R)-hydroxyalkanoic acid synthase [Ureibacillus manganicus DSM 26584]
MINLDTKPLERIIENLPKDPSMERMKKVANVLFVEPEPKVGQTPKEVIWTKNKAKLYRFQPNMEKTNKVPILMIYALINKPYILDLYPGNSLIEYLTNKGHDVYLLDWGEAGYEDRHKKLEDYILDYIPRAAKKVLKHSGAKEISMFGYCMGGTMTAIFTALYNKVLPIRNLLLLTTPIDFSDAGMYTNWLDKRYFKLDNLVDTLGNIPFEMIDFGNKLLSPLATTLGAYVTLADKIDNEDSVLTWKLMQHWLNDGVPFPGESYRQWIRDFYQENKLVNDELVVRGQKVLLSDITANLFTIAATHDNIVSPSQTTPLMDKVSSKDKTLEIVQAGHVSVVTGRKAVAERFPLIENWITEHSK